MSWSNWDALGSILGGTFSGGAFFATLFLLIREIRIRRAEQEDEQARQARLVVSRVGQESYPLQSAFRTLELEGTVANYSRMPIFNLVVALEDVGSGQEGFRMLNPGESVSVRLVIHRPADGKPMDMMAPRTIGLSLHFLDADGRHWHRRGTEQPRRVLSGARSETVPLERFRPEELRRPPAGEPSAAGHSADS